MQKGNILTSIIAALSVALGSLTFNAFLELAVGDRGAIRVGSRISLGEATYIAVDIDNFGDSYLDSVSLMIPANTDLQGIATSYPISISWSAWNSGAGSRRVVLLSRIQPESKCRILVPYAMGDNGADVVVVNALELDLESHQGDNVSSYRAQIIEDAAVYAIVVFLGVLVVTLWMSSRVSKIETQGETITKELKDTQSRLEKEIAVTHKQLAYYRAFLVKRTSDLATELGFWRDTIRKMLYERGASEKDAGKLVKAVTKNLGTFTAAQDIDASDFKLLTFLAEALSSEGSQNA